MSICTVLLGASSSCGVKGAPPVSLAIAPLILLAIAFAMLAVSYIIQSLIMKTNKPKPAGLDQWDFPQVDDGTPQAVPFGDVWTEAAMVCWYGNYRTSKIKSSGGK